MANKFDNWLNKVDDKAEAGGKKKDNQDTEKADSI